MIKEVREMEQSKLMGNITAVVLLLIIGYAVGVFLGKFPGDIASVMLLMTVVSFIYWLYEKLCLRPRRIKTVLDLEGKLRSTHEGLPAEELQRKIKQTVGPVAQAPWWIEWTAGFFWVILIVFVVRSFWIEPYRIPSGSMMPTLEDGDFILVKKYEYGLKFPVFNYQIGSFKSPERGDVVVFDSPVEKLVLIKRVIGLPGDMISYQDKQLTINGELVPLTKTEQFLNTVENNGVPVWEPQYREDLGEVSHHILRHPYFPMRDNLGPGSPYFVVNRPYYENCEFQGADFSCKVPEGHYFMMGDNRDFSLDSRYWGFVPQENITGKAFMIWLNTKKLSRIGRFN